MGARRICPPLLAALAVLVGGDAGVRALAKPGSWIDLHTSIWDASFSRRFSLGLDPPPPVELVVAGSSLSREKEVVTLASELTRALGTEVRNESGDGHFLADEWAAVLARGRPAARRHLIELNPFLFNERRWLYAPRASGELVRRSENALSIFSVAGTGVRRALLFEPGLHPLLASAVRRVFRPYDVGLGLRETLRTTLRDAVLRRLRPAEVALEVAPERLLELVARNFGAKNYSDGPDSPVLANLLDWSSSQPEPRAYVLYVPPLNWTLLARQPADAERLQTWLDGLRVEAERRGLSLLDASGLFATREALFSDYGHLRDRAFAPLAEFVAAELAKLP
jgi:hypothetical protein